MTKVKKPNPTKKKSKADKKTTKAEVKAEQAPVQSLDQPTAVSRYAEGIYKYGRDWHIHKPELVTILGLTTNDITDAVVKLADLEHDRRVAEENKAFNKANKIKSVVNGSDGTDKAPEPTKIETKKKGRKRVEEVVETVTIGIGTELTYGEGTSEPPLKHETTYVPVKVSVVTDEVVTDTVDAGGGILVDIVERKKPAAESKKPTPVESRKKPAKKVATTEDKKIFGLPATAILRWMGADCWKLDEARKAMDKLGFTWVADPTIQTQVRVGMSGSTARGPIPELTEEQETELRELLKD